MTPKEQFLCLIANDTVQKADAIVILEGDGLVRVQEGARLFREGFAPLVVISGGVNHQPFSIPAREMLPYLVQAGVPESHIVLEENSQHTRDQAVEIMKFARDRGWQGMIIVASHYHQYRAYLTFLQAMKEANLSLRIMNAPVRNLPWFTADVHGRRLDLLVQEFDRIEQYRAQGHVATYEDAIAYQEMKETL